MSLPAIDVKDYSSIAQLGRVIDKDGYHKPNKGYHKCSCELETEKGAYRDVIVEAFGTTIVYLHQHPIVLKDESVVELYSRGYETTTTKQRLNEHTPSGYKVIQRDFDWYVSTPDGRDEFEEGYQIHI
jgi:hypothetical protein